MINRNYEYLKLKRTYIGGSKEKELEIFSQVQNIDGNGTCDWIEYRRILFPYFEDVMHINFSRSFASKRLAYALLGISFLLGFLHLTVFSVIVILFSVLLRVLNIFFEKKITETLSSYNISVPVIKREIKILTGLDM